MKKLIPLLLVAVLLIAAVSGASFAYFTDTISSNENIIISGNIEIRQQEQERSAEGTLQPFTQNRMLMPMVPGSGEETLTISGHEVSLPNGSWQNYVDKIVNVCNTGVNPAYLRTVIAVPYAGGAQWIHLKLNEAAGISWSGPVVTAIKGETYAVYTATYDEPLAPGEFCAPSLLGFWVDSYVDFNGTDYILGDVNLGDLSQFRILVATEAVQTTTFDTVSAAMEATFGIVSADTNPWSNHKTHYVDSDADLQILLASDKLTSGDTIRLADGSYTLPETVHPGIRIVGQSDNVRLSLTTLRASAVELHNLTVTTDFVFTGSGELDQVTFLGAFTATFDNPAYITDCGFASAPHWSVAEDAVRGTVIFESCTGPAPVYQ